MSGAGGFGDSLDDGFVAALRREAAERLTAAGHVPDPQWRRVLETFPREEFAPGLWVPRDLAWAFLDGHDDADRAEWLREVYAGGPLVVKLAGATRLDGPARLYSGTVEVATVPTARYLAALHALDPRPGHRILELGLGAGIGAGMIAHHLAPFRRSSDPPVVAAEIDAALADSTAKLLARLDYAVDVHVADALAPDLPVPLTGPFDRLIATFPVPGLPATWLSALAPGGRLVMQLNEAKRLLVLDKASDGTGVGLVLREDRPGAHPVTAARDGRLFIVRGPGPVWSVAPYAHLPATPAHRKDPAS